MRRLPPVIPTFLRDLPLACDALLWADELHSGQRREVDAAPFVLHPLEVASLLHNTGHADEVVAAGILHDAVEESDAQVADVDQRFGGEVAAIVAAMTEDPAIEPYEERKAALRKQIADFGPHASAVYAADKVAKVRELRAQATHDPALLAAITDGHPKMKHYEESLVMLEEVDPEHPLVRQLRFELETLRGLPPAGSSNV
jgi:(p)ppGpp synthase/HD superfamily hydrolase